MSVLEGLEPGRVFHYFEEITKIPHGSGNTKAISNYLVEFAKKQGLSWIQDESNNIIIKKPASVRCENAPTVILQGHCDMVCEKKPGSSHDFLKDPLDLAVEGDEIFAKDTTLGGDDGIAVAYMLAILEANDLVHPALEAVITVDEEIGLLGAAALDCSELKGRILLNLDSEEEGILTVSCAGGMTAVSSLPIRRNEVSGVHYQVSVCGLTGGHSGAEIHKNRANSNQLAGRFLFELAKRTEYEIAELEGGMKDNAIPRATQMLLVIDGSEQETLKDTAKKIEADFRKEYSGSDECITILVERTGEGPVPALHPISRQKVLFFLMNYPNGVQKMSSLVPGLVETSLNLGIVTLMPDCLETKASVRSSVGSAKEAVSEKIEYLTEFLGGDYHVEGAYPAWEYRTDSMLRDLCVEEYEKLYGVQPAVEAIHAGLECGIFFEKLPGLDSVSFGPNMKAIHTTEERLQISSVKRTYEYLLKILERIARSW
ncbi:MAG: aminoacyl-histidine dipeptidase [Fusicatenibacter sp.]